MDTIPDYLRGEVVDQIDETKLPDKNLDAPDITLYKTQLMLKKLQKDLADINSRFIETYLKEDANNDLKRFGDDLFNTLQTSFAPTNNFNPSNTYVLDSGDIVGLTIIGNNAGNHKIKISNDGTINIPKIGKLSISGLNISQAFTNINNFVQERSLGSEVYTNIENLKDIQVFMIGGVEVQGAYTLPGNTNILHALNNANGISENGSFRDIQILRNGSTVESFDLYEIFISGNFKNDFQFSSGDIIKVGYLDQQAAVSGGVNNPAIYEFKNGDTVKTIINFSGGFSPYANKDKIEVIRSNSDENFSKVLSYKDYDAFTIKPMDNIYVYSFKPLPKKVITIQIKGEVNKPGTYNLSEGASFADLIIMAGGYTENSYPFGTQLYRENLKKAESAIRTKLLDSISNSIFSSTNTGSSSPGQEDALQFFYNELKTFEPIGRLNGDFDIDKDMVLDQSVLLEDGDVVAIPKFSNTISVYGQVNNPGTYLIDNNNDLNTYIKYAGGIGYFGDKNRIVLIQPDGKSYLVNRSFLSQYKNNNITIYPGSLIYIPRDFNVLDNTQYLSVVAPIFSSVALSIASLNSLN